MEKNAFTLLELLIVIAIISILSSILIVMIDPKSSSSKAKAARIAVELNQITKAFEMSGLDNQRKSFFTESELGLGENPNVSLMTLLDMEAIGYLPKDVPIVAEGFGGNTYRYDNDDNYIYRYLNDCPGMTDYRGANIFVVNSGLYPEVINELDKMIDNGNGLKCGKVRTIGNTFFYSLGNNNY